jgi:hypothetical protein
VDPDSAAIPVTLTSTTDRVLNFTAPVATEPYALEFTVEASDPHDTISRTITVNVEVNRPPVADAGPNATSGNGALVQLDGTGSFDPDGNDITYQWTQVDLFGNPVPLGDPLYVALSDPTAAQPTFTAPVVALPNNLLFNLQVTDSLGLSSDVDQVVITIQVNQAPRRMPAPTRTPSPAAWSPSTAPVQPIPMPMASPRTSGSRSTRTAIRSRLGGEQSVIITNANSAVATFDAPLLNYAHTLYFKLTVADAGGLSDTDTMSVVVSANRPPTGLPNPTVLPATRTAGNYAQLTMPLGGTDPDGTSNTLFTYDWIQVSSAAGTTDCRVAEGGAGCPNSDVTLITSGPALGGFTPSDRQPVFLIPGHEASAPNLFFRSVVNDGFGATAQSNSITVSITNSAPSVQFAVRGPGSPPPTWSAPPATATRCGRGPSATRRS